MITVHPPEASLLVRRTRPGAIHVVIEDVQAALRDVRKQEQLDLAGA